MAESNGTEKTEQPTGKKLSDARDKGQVPKSTEINSLVVFGIGFTVLYISRGFIGEKIGNFSKVLFGSLETFHLNAALIQGYFFEWALLFFILLAPVLLTIMIGALISNISQFGFKFATEALKPKMSKFNFISNFKGMLFSVNSAVELLKSIVKLTIISLFAYSVISKQMDDSTMLIHLSIEEIVAFMLSSAFTLVWKIALLFTLIAATDMVFQRVKFTKNMMMTKQEVKEELKQSEGDPHIKQRIRKQMFKMAMKRMMKDVPKADVVITNPTHFAVAVKYDMNRDGAPKVLAKGMDEVAQRIKKIALENNVPLHEDVQLARALYKSCEIGDEIPAKLFKAVAQILAYIYQMKRIKKRKSIV